MFIPKMKYFTGLKKLPVTLNIYHHFVIKMGEMVQMHNIVLSFVLIQIDSFELDSQKTLQIQSVIIALYEE